MNEIPSWISTAGYGAALNHIQVLSSPRKRCMTFNMSRIGGFLVAARSCSTFLHLMRSIQVGGTIDEQMRLTPALVSRWRLAMSMVEAEILHVTQSL